VSFVVFELFVVRNLSAVFDWSFSGNHFVQINDFLLIKPIFFIRKVPKMKAKIDYDLCMGDRNCNKLCPQVFDYDVDQLQARVIVDEVPEQYQDLVRQAAAECAPGAIIVEE
jgi:ferredoxin